LSLPETVLKRLKVHAAEHNQSMSSLMVRAIEELLKQKDDWEEQKKKFLEGMRNPPDLGTGGKVPWTRDELHER
jgi:hypothetical protein